MSVINVCLFLFLLVSEIQITPARIARTTFFINDVHHANVNAELKICTAAFFRNKGKEVITVMELIMTISLDLRWMDATTASRFVKLIVSEELVTATPDGLLKATGDLTTIDVPVAYKPSRELLEFIRTASPDKKEASPKTQIKKEKMKKDDDALLPKLMEIATSIGMQKGTFISECNKIVKKLNIDTEVAALIVLRDRGADIARYYDLVYISASKK